MGMFDFITSMCNRLLLPWWVSAVQYMLELCRDPEAASNGSIVWHLCGTWFHTDEFAENHVGAV